MEQKIVTDNAISIFFVTEAHTAFFDGRQLDQAVRHIKLMPRKSSVHDPGRDDQQIAAANGKLLVVDPSDPRSRADIHKLHKVCVIMHEFFHTLLDSRRIIQPIGIPALYVFLMPQIILGFQQIGKIKLIVPDQRYVFAFL